jgi:hypothetical protein
MIPIYERKNTDNRLLLSYCRMLATYKSLLDYWSLHRIELNFASQQRASIAQEVTDQRLYSSGRSGDLLGARHKRPLNCTLSPRITEGLEGEWSSRTPMHRHHTLHTLPKLIITSVGCSAAVPSPCAWLPSYHLYARLPGFSRVYQKRLTSAEDPFVVRMEGMLVVTCYICKEARSRWFDD